MNEVEKTANSLLSHFEDSSEASKKVAAVQNSDPFAELKVSLLSFFKDQMNRISVQERLQQRIEEELESHLDRGELTFDQLMRMHSQVTKQNNSSVDSFLGIFKPTPGAPSILAANLAEQEKERDVFDEIYDDLNSDQLQKLDRLSKLLEMMGKERDDSE